MAKRAWKVFTTPLLKQQDDSLKIFESAKQFKIEARGFSLQAYKWNEGAPKTVLVLHGWELSAMKMRRVIEPLIKAGFEVIAIDAPAHGYSTGKQTNAPHFAWVLEDALWDLEDVDHIVGYSFGGIAAAILLQEAEIFIEKLVLMGTPTSMEKVILRFQRFLWLPDNLVKKIIQLPTSWDKDRKYTDFRVDLNRLKDSTNEVLIVHDVHDDIVPFSDAEETLARGGNRKAHLFSTENFGHHSIIRDKKVVLPVIEFLAG